MIESAIVTSKASVGAHLDNRDCPPELSYRLKIKNLKDVRESANMNFMGGGANLG